ncbi:MAG: hypothetical protein ACE5K2_04250, partial [Candidatus Zixiibacteriota bacterium]
NDSHLSQLTNEIHRKRTFALTFILFLKGEEIISSNRQDAPPFGRGASLFNLLYKFLKLIGTVSYLLVLWLW